MRQQSQTGFTLVEVLVSAGIMSIGLLGAAGMQINAVKNSDHAYLRSQAVFYSGEIIDRMRANKSAVSSGYFDMQMTNLDSLDTPGEGDHIAEQALYHWLTKVSDAIPAAQASIDCDANNLCQIIIQWDGSRYSTDYESSTSSVSVASQL